MSACEGCPTKRITFLETWCKEDGIYTGVNIIPCLSEPGVPTRNWERMGYCIKRWHREQNRADAQSTLMQ